MTMSSPKPSRPASPEAGPERERKRRRKVLSCYDCRRRKLQCDRATPACGRCTKAGNAANCLYMDEGPARDSITQASDSGVNSLATTKHDIDPRFKPIVPGSDSITSRLEYQDRRIKQLEAALHSQSQLRSKLPLTPESGTEPMLTVVDRESMCFRGKSFKTTFFGSTHPGATISYVPDLNKFTKELLEKFPALQRLRSDIHDLDEMMGIEDGLQQLVQDSQMKALMPPKAEVDGLIHLYVDTYDPIYHIIHLPSFWKEYEEMWSDMTTTSTHFVALVLLMMACVSCLSSTPARYVATSSVSRENAISWIRHCEDWIGRQSQKHVTVADFQIRCLLWLAKQTSARKFKRTWTEAGNLLRFCMSSGLHRNPDLIPKETSTLDKDLRRRIWATAVDFELQASFDRGMVSAPWLLQSDANGPGNFHDEDFSASGLPVSRSLQDFTPSSFLALANDSYMLRSTLNAVLNNIRQTLSFDEVKQYTEEIESHLRSIPDWTDRRSHPPKALLSLRLRQYLLVLHDRHLRHATTLAERSFSRSILLETLIQIVETHKALVEQGNLALELYSFDAIRVAVSVANLQSYIDPKLDLAFSISFDALIPQLMVDTITIVKDKVLRFGREYRQFWVTLTCDALLKSIKNPEQRSTHMQQMADAVIEPLYRVIACQDRPTPFSLQKDVNGVKERQGGAQQADVTALSANTATAMDTSLLDLDDIADWTFQDWYNPVDMQDVYQTTTSGLVDLPPPA